MATKEYKLGQIAEFLGAELRGNPDCIITSIAPLAAAGEGQISFLEKAQYREFLSKTEASAVILKDKHASLFKGNALIVIDPYVSYAKLSSWFKELPQYKPGIHPRAVIGNNCQIANSTYIGANCVIGDGVTIGDDCYLYPNVTIYYGVKIGSRVIIHSGAVIGADGFGMANDNGVWRKIHQLGAVEIGDDVEIGANTCIDRGALENTVIENGVKLDNQVQIGHNVRIGAHTVIAGCTAIAGSTIIGKHCMIGGGVSFNGHINIADRVIITGASVVGRSITEPGVYSSAVTVQPHRAWMKILLRLLCLDELANKVRKLEVKSNE